MNTHNQKVAATPETLTSAIDVINLHPDRQDVLAVNNVVVEAIEVNALSTQSIIDNTIANVSCIFKDNLLNHEGTLQTRAPRPLFMGPTKRNRGSRGARKNTNKGVTGNINWIPSTTDNITVERSTEPNNNAPKTPKRIRSGQPSPNVSISGVPSKPKKQKTFAEAVANDLKLQIHNVPNGISNDQLISIENGLMNELDKYLTTIPTPTSIPTYHTSSFYNGILKLICADTFSADWIKNVIANMPPPWEGANLEINTVGARNANPFANRQETRQRTPRRPTVRFFIPSGMSKPKFDAISKRLQLQNRPLDTSNWIAWKADEKEGGVFYHVSVDESDVEIIKASNSRLFYCFTKIKVSLPKESRGANSIEGVMMEGVEVEQTE